MTDEDTDDLNEVYENAEAFFCVAIMPNGRALQAANIRSVDGYLSVQLLMSRMHDELCHHFLRGAADSDDEVRH